MPRNDPLFVSLNAGAGIAPVWTTPTRQRAWTWRSCPDPEPPSPDLFPEPILDLSHRMYSHLQILRRLPIPDHLNCRPKIRVRPVTTSCSRNVVDSPPRWRWECPDWLPAHREHSEDSAG